MGNFLNLAAILRDSKRLGVMLATTLSLSLVLTLFSTKDVGAYTNCGWPQGYWCEEYYNNENLEGYPVIFTYYKDSPLNGNALGMSHNWSNKSPGSSVPNDHFSAGFNGRAYLTVGLHTITYNADDKIRIYVEGKKIVDVWPTVGCACSTNVFYFQVGQSSWYKFRVEYAERIGDASVSVGIR